MKSNCTVNEVNRMRVVMAFVWGFLLMNMAVYVISAMTGGTYNFATASILGGVFTLVVILIGELGVPNKPANDHH
jgi:hypothetical protein